MIKMFGMLDKRSDISQEQFHAHWRGPHAVHAVKLVPVMKQYCQNHKTARDYPGFDKPCDGSPEVWVDDLDASAWMGRMPEYMTGAFIDEPNFMRERSGGVMVSEHIALENTGIGKDDQLTKVLFFIKRSPSLSHRSFVEQWLARETPLLVGGANLSRWVRSPILEEAYANGEAKYDGVEELWWSDDSAHQKDALETPAADALRLVDLDATTAMFVDENRVVWPE
ncbi:MAG: EthD domain-containing protein [Proteobacteria bacterium]|nr:EthD domain-containing protein [Pseudomonadota bacterium]